MLNRFLPGGDFIFLVTKEFTFDAAHRLERYHGKCEELHGHTYRLSISVKGELDDEGMVIDFLELKALIKEHVLSHLDHKYLNEVIEQPTAENIAKWVFDAVKPLIDSEKRKLHEVRVWETVTSSATYRESQ